MSWTLRAALAAVFCVALAVTVGIYSPVGYGSVHTGTRGCFASLYNAPAQNARIAFFGSSRVQLGLKAEAISHALNLRPGAVINLAHSGISLDMDRALARRLVASHDIDLLVFEIQAVSPALKARSEEVKPLDQFAVTQTTTGPKDGRYVGGIRFYDQMLDISEQSQGPVVGAWDLTLLQRARIQSALKMFVEIAKTRQLREEFLSPYKRIGIEHGERKVDCFQKSWSKPFKPGENTLKGRILRAYLKAFAAPPRGEGWVDPDPEGFFTSDENAGERRQIERIVALGKREGVRVAFLYLPAIEVPYSPERLKTRFEKQFGAPLLAPDTQMHEAWSRAGYRDATHLNSSGRQLLEPWLVKEIDRLLGKTAP